MAPTTSTSDSPPLDESDDISRSAAVGSFRLAGAAAFFPASPSGRGAGDQYSRTFAYKTEDIPSRLQPNRCATYGKHGKNNSRIEQLGVKAEQLGKAENTYGSGRPLQAMCLRAPFVPDHPLHHMGDPVRSFVPGDLSVLPRGWILATPVLKTGVHLVLNRLHQPFTEG